MLRRDLPNVGNAINEMRNGNRDVELVMNENGEMIAVPKSQADQMDAVKAGAIAKKPYYK